MDHCFEAQIDFAGANDLGDILHHPVSKNLSKLEAIREKTYTRIIRLQKSNLDTFILEKALGLSQV